MPNPLKKGNKEKKQNNVRKKFAQNEDRCCNQQQNV